MLTYNDVNNDSYVRDIYNYIDEYSKGRYWTTHGYSHIETVVELVDKMLILLNVDERTRECGKIAAVLHDIGCYYGKEDHCENSTKMAITYLGDKKLNEGEKELIINAIKNHSDGSCTNSIIDATLFFADKIDIKKSRVLPDGLKVEGVRQWQYIDDIIIDINEALKVNFIVDNKIDMKELNEFYFMPKVFNAIKIMAKYLNKDSEIMINNKEWII